MIILCLVGSFISSKKRRKRSKITSNHNCLLSNAQNIAVNVQSEYIRRAIYKHLTALVENVHILDVTMKSSITPNKHHDRPRHMWHVWCVQRNLQVASVHCFCATSDLIALVSSFQFQRNCKCIKMSQPFVFLVKSYPVVLSSLAKKKEKGWLFVIDPTQTLY